MGAPEKLLTPPLSEAPCNGCANVKMCVKGHACWDYVDFESYGATKNLDRRPSKTIHQKLVLETKRTVTNGMRVSIDDYIDDKSK